MGKREGAIYIKGMKEYFTFYPIKLVFDLLAEVWYPKEVSFQQEKIVTCINIRHCIQERTVEAKF